MDGAVADPDGDGMSNLQEHLYLQPRLGQHQHPSVLDNGVVERHHPVNGTRKTPAVQSTRLRCLWLRRYRFNHPLR